MLDQYLIGFLIFVEILEMLKKKDFYLSARLLTEEIGLLQSSFMLADL